MHRYWFDLLLLAYAFTGIDLIFTAHGILLHGYSEGNPLVTMIFPNGVAWQVPAMVAASIFSFWVIYYSTSKFPAAFNNYKNLYLNFISGTMIALCITHTIATATWILY